MKELIFVADSHSALAEFPDPVQRHVGFALYQAQMGNKHIDAKPLKNVAAGVLEVVSDHRGDTFRTVYTVADQCRLCAARISEKVETRHSHATERDRSGETAAPARHRN